VIERVQQFTGLIAAGVDAEILVDALQKLHAGHAGIEDQGGAMVLVLKTAQQGAQEGGFAGADLAGQAHETMAVVNAVEQVGKGLLVVMAQVDKPGIGGQGKRFFVETEMCRVHRQFLPKGIQADTHSTCIPHNLPVFKLIPLFAGVLAHSLRSLPSDFGWFVCAVSAVCFTGSQAAVAML